MIPQNNPLANYLSYQPAIDRAIQRVLKGGSYILGEETAIFEREFAGYTGVQYALGVGNGTEALHLALRGLGIGSGDEVITVSQTAVATVAAIEMSGAKPVLVDIDPSSFTMDPEEVEKAITETTKAVLPVHLYGHPADLQPLIECAKHHSLYLLEDCAQSHGALYQGRRVGSWGDAGAFSFYPTKNLGCLGDGGAITTNSPVLYERILALRQYGWDKRRISRVPGYNSRLDELQAAVLRVKLKYLDENNRKRSLVAHAYHEALSKSNLIPPPTRPDATHVYHQYVVRCPDPLVRNDLIDFMLKRDIQTAIHYPVPVHLQPAYIGRTRTINGLSKTEKACETILSFPMFPELTQAHLDHIVAVLEDFLRKAK